MFPPMPPKKRTAKKRRGRPRTITPKNLAPNALSLWLMRNEISVQQFADLLGVCTSTVYGWKRGRAPFRYMAATIERLTDGEVPMNSWD